MDKTLAIFAALTVFSPSLSNADDKVSMEQLNQLKAVCEAVKTNPRLAKDKEFYPSWQKPFVTTMPDFWNGTAQKNTKVSFSLKGGFHEKGPFHFTSLEITASQEKDKVTGRVILERYNGLKITAFSKIQKPELRISKVSGRLWSMVSLERGNGSATHCDSKAKFGATLWEVIRLAAQSLKAKTWR